MKHKPSTLAESRTKPFAAGGTLVSILTVCICLWQEAWCCSVSADDGQGSRHVTSACQWLNRHCNPASDCFCTVWCLSLFRVSVCQEQS